MNQVTPSLATSGPEIVNCLDAMLFLADHGAIKTFDPPELPTSDDLGKLTAGVREERAKSVFGPVTRMLLEFLQLQNGLIDARRGVVDEPTAALLNRLLEQFGAFADLSDDQRVVRDRASSPTATALVVRGTILDTSGDAVSKALVHAYDCDVRNRQLLDEATTGSDGYYSISYAANAFARAEKGSADLLVCVMDAGGKTLVSSDVLFNAPADAVINLVLPGVPSKARVVSEFDLLVRTLLPLLKGQGTHRHDLPIEALDTKDVDFLASDTGLDRQHIAWLAQASKSAHETGSDAGDAPVTRSRAQMPAPEGTDIPPEAFYGWFRLGLPAELSALWATPTDTLVSTLKAAVAQHVVPHSISAKLNGISKRVEQTKLDLVLKAPAPSLGTAASLGGLLATSPMQLHPDQQRVIAGAAPDLRPDDPGLVGVIAGLPGFDAAAAAAVARTLRLGALTEGHLPLAQALQQRAAKESDGSLRPLAMLRPDEWIDLAYTHGTPAGMSITPVAYADSLAASIERQYPTASLTAHLADGPLGRHPALAHVDTFLANNPTFDISAANLNAVIDQTKLDGIPKPQQQQLVVGLKALKSMNGLGASWDETAALLDNDLQSPHQLLAAGPTQLAARLDGRIAPERVAALFEQAEELHNVTFAAMSAGFSPLSAPRIMPTVAFVNAGGGDSANPEDFSSVALAANPLLGANTTDSTGSAKIVDLPTAVAHHLVQANPQGYKIPPVPPVVVPDDTAQVNAGPQLAYQPTLQALFGSQDACACGDCSSVLSPAAYFVDLLQFAVHADPDCLLLGNSDKVGRRPDLQDIELSCNNSNTEVPTIDLVLEVLENAVAFRLPVNLRSGTNIEDELISGSNVGPDVYAALKQTAPNLADNVVAFQGLAGDWTAVDGHRRWTLTAQNENALKATSGKGQGPALPMVTSGINLPALIAALDGRRVGNDAEPAFADLFEPKQTPAPPYSNYRVTIIPKVAGTSWQVSYQVVANLVIKSPHVTLQTTKGVSWWSSKPQNPYSQNTIAAVEDDLKKGAVPELVRKPLASQFPNAGTFTLERRQTGGPWTIVSELRHLTLNLAPARLEITSLTYQSGDADVDALAEPDNHNPTAYVKLRGATAVFPWSLPFDLPLEEVRLFLTRARSSRRALIEAATPVDPAGVAQGDALRQSVVFAREVLGLSEAEAGLIEQTPLDIYPCWGLTSGQTSIIDVNAGQVTGLSPLTLLRNVSVLLQQSRLDFASLQKVLATGFVQDNTGPLLIEPSSSCKPSDMNIASLSVGHLDRIHRFVRLQRRLGWLVEDLDAAIQITAAGAIDLLKLTDLVRLSELLALPIGIILKWYAKPTVPDPSAGVTTLLNTRALAQALGLTTEEMAHASALFSVPDVLVNLDATFGFCQQVKEYKGSGISFEDLRYVLQHHETDGSSVVLSPVQVLELNDAARTAVRSVPDVPTSPPATPTELAATQLAREDAAITALATTLGAERDLVDNLLRTTLRQPPSDAGQPAIDVVLDESIDVTSVLVRLHKTVFLCRALNLRSADMVLLRSSASGASGFTALDFNTLPVAENPAVSAADFEKLVDGCGQLFALARLRGLGKGAGDLLHQYAVLDFSAPTWEADTHTVLSTGLLLDSAKVGEVDAAASQLHITTAEQHRDPRLFASLVKLLSALKQLGAAVAQVSPTTVPSAGDPNGLASASPDDADATAARSLLRAKYGDSQWHDLIKPISDTLRGRQRDALVDYLVNLHHLRGADDLYDTYLIDVQIGSCMITTRLLQATAAVQLFIQRVLLNLEPGASFGDDDDPRRSLWEWMQNYQVWVANRKVFLFPENWLLPELRDDKTAIFTEMEGALTQQEPSLETTRDALLGYLEEFVGLAQIGVVAMYQDVTTLYVVGRTPNQPYRYFWRTCSGFGSTNMLWSGWEQLDLDNANDFILPFVFENDLYMAWPIFSKTVDEKDEDNLLWEVQIAWTKRTKQGWVKRTIGHTELDSVTRLPNKEAFGSFAFRLAKDVSEVSILGAKPLPLETISIYCYAANEVIDSPAFTVDPNLANADPKPTGPVDTANWNTQLLSVSGVAYEWAVVDQANKITKYVPMVGVTVLVNWQFQPDPTGPKAFGGVTSTDANGEFNFGFNYPGNTQSNGQVFNGGQITLTFLWPSDATSPGVPIVVSKVLVDLSGKGHSAWTWRFSVGRENKNIAGEYRADRPVVYKPAGTFVFEPGKDLNCGPTSTFQPPFDKLGGVDDVIQTISLSGGPQLRFPMLVDGNRFITSGDALVIPVDGSTPSYAPIGSISFPSLVLLIAPWMPRRQLNLPIVITRATQPSVTGGTAETQIWFVQDGLGGFYVQKQDATAQAWADGQPFVPSYRIEASVSIADLFQPSFEEHLHVDSNANTFERQNAYANYNWELFLHAPLAIADYFASHQRFADARRWLHAVFNPTTSDVDSQQVPRVWRFQPFADDAQPEAIATLLTWLADPAKVDAADASRISGTLTNQIAQWKQNPFLPHLIARLRPSAYQWSTFFAYLDMLIGWGDQLFRRDTREFVNDATLLYVLAAKLLGPRPRVIPAPVPPAALTYRLLRSNPDKLDDFSDPWVDYAHLPGIQQLTGAQANGTGSSQSYAAQSSSGFGSSVQTAIPRVSAGTGLITSLSSLAFCVPQNDKVTGYYDRIEKALFNVRHCRNIDGIARDLPLYDQPIDPLLLIRARAAGLDLYTAIAGLSAPLPNYRFTFTLQKAIELTAELKMLGAALLASLEKQDAEDLAQLRSGHEVAILKLVRDTRLQQVAEADANVTALEQSKETVLGRFGQYQKLLGKPGITTGQDGLPVIEQSSALTVSTDPVGGASGLGLSRREIEQFARSADAHEFTQIANEISLIGGILSLFPNIWAGSPVAGQTFGGSNLGICFSVLGKAMEMGAAEATYFANLAGTFAGYERRQDEWVHQSRLALAEMKQIDKQILAAQIRKDIAQKELDSHEAQMTNAQEIDDVLHSKFTNQELYRWMSSQVSDVYFDTYQIALDQAQRAERAYRFELGDTDSAPFIEAGHWDSLKRGLMAGEHLHHDLKRLEGAYLQRNVREFEITKHISLLQLDPIALIVLKETGTCVFDVPEAFFDLDCPGHYMRRIKTVSLSIPCVAGPYAGVNATLSLTGSTTRISPAAPAATEHYFRHPASDPDSRFTSTAASVTAIVTSGAQQDTGMFEPNLRDERYLPFEGAGVISSWTLELPTTFPSFDYSTIADVVLHLRYTARDGGVSLKNAVVDQLESAVDAIVTAAAKAAATAAAPATSGLVRLFSLRHEFPNEWNRFLNPVGTQSETLEIDLTAERFPFLFRGTTLTVTKTEMFLKFRDESDPESVDGTFAQIYAQASDTLTASVSFSPLDGTSTTDSTATDTALTPMERFGWMGYSTFVASSIETVPRKWRLEFKESAIANISGALTKDVTIDGTAHARLRPEVIQDVFVAFHYTIKT